MILFSSSFTIGLDLSEAQGFDELKTCSFPVISSLLDYRSAQPFSAEQYALIAEGNRGQGHRALGRMCKSAQTG